MTELEKMEAFVGGAPPIVILGARYTLFSRGHGGKGDKRVRLGEMPSAWV